MAYDPNNLSAMAYANGYTQWHYKTSDPLPVVRRIGYFDNAAALLRVDDMIVINTSRSLGYRSNAVAFVDNNDGKEVEITVGLEA